MAATLSPWAKPGAWALDSEEHEAELQKEERGTGSSGTPATDFPSLAAAAATKTSKKKKGQTLSLAEFSTGVSVAPGSARSAQPSPGVGLTPDEMLSLPTGPRQRTAEELDRSRLGGGFRSYGSNGYDSGRSRYSNGDDSPNSRWGPRVSDETRRQGGFGRDANKDLMPSRADEIDDWGAAKKSSVGNGFERRERGGFFDSHSRADDSDNWASNKNFVASEGRRFGASFDRDRRGGGFESLSKESDSDFWGKKKEEGIGSADSEFWGKKKEEGIGNAGGGGRPRLNLQPRTLPVSSVQQPGSGPVANSKSSGSNPFGEARPREDVLAEKGQDWKKIDEQLESVKIKETGLGSDGPGLGKNSFGGVNGRTSLPEDRTVRSWRKTDGVDGPPSSAEEIENQTVEEN
ncbi:eukaryotic translation initiation factor 4B3 [Malania oleifera]|uniref:eukaryotic translation initiation factor 4B3 n=1 Tax=Malania oleifera TaxID=397392 RepID=UPI0025ADA308|nr:eukaryotic translation initiation factor 4B3 [Malania oleifera]